MSRRVKYSGYIASVVSLTAALFMLGVVLYGATIWRSAAQSLAGEVIMSVIVDDSISTADRSAIEGKIASLKEVESYKFIDKESAAKEFSAYIGSDVTALLGENPLPGLYSLSVDAAFSSTESMERIKGGLASQSGVQSIVYESEIAERFANGMSTIRGLLLGFAAVLIFVSVVLIYNTTRLMIGANGDEIHSMRLVGARKSVIFAPYLQRSVIGGAVAGVFACLALWFGVTAASDVIAAAGIDNQMLIYIFSAIVVIGVALSCACTYISLYQQIKR